MVRQHLILTENQAYHKTCLCLHLVDEEATAFKAFDRLQCLKLHYTSVVIHINARLSTFAWRTSVKIGINM